MERQLNLVFVGHIDHGKSTLIGRLMYDTDSIPKEKIEEIERTCKELGVPMEFAYITDALEEERKKNITIDTTQVFFKGKKRDYVIIDAPGHKEFLKNMVTGASYADAAILIVDAHEGVQEQTKRHAYILSFLGIDQVIVVINKMDKVGWEESRFVEVKNTIQDFLSKLGVSPLYVIPISAYKGDNVVKKSENMPWYKGPTVLDALESLEITQEGYKYMRFPVQLIYDYKGKKVALGSIISGELKVGEEVVVLPENIKARINEILEMNKTLESAHSPKAVGLDLDTDIKMRRGQLLATGKLPRVTKEIEGSFICLRGEVDEKEEVEVFIMTQESKAIISEIKSKINIETLEKEAGKTIKEAEIGIVTLSLENPMVIEKYSDMRELGRFIVKKNGRIVGGGIII